MLEETVQGHMARILHFKVQMFNLVIEKSRHRKTIREKDSILKVKIEPNKLLLQIMAVRKDLGGKVG